MGTMVKDEVVGVDADSSPTRSKTSKTSASAIVLSPRRGAKRKAKDESVKKRKEIIKELKSAQKEEGIEMEDMDSDGMEEDEEALLEAMDAEDAAAAEMDK